MTRTSAVEQAGQSFPSRREYEERQFDEPDTGPDVIELLICNADGPVGVVEFDPLDIATDTATLSYWLVPDARGEGYA